MAAHPIREIRKMSKLRLTYFDFHGGRGEPIRLAMFIGGITFEDNRIKGSDWPVLKPGIPFQAIPVLEVDGKTISQSNTILRFVGKLAGLYPEDPWQAALCDEVMDAVEDLNARIGTTIFMADPEAKKVARDALAQGPLPVYLARLNAYLEERGGEYFSDQRLTVADLKMYSLVAHLSSGVLDHIPADLAKRVAPALARQYEQLEKDPRIVSYYQAHREP
jgi:glutathione S-transferase